MCIIVVALKHKELLEGRNIVLLEVLVEHLQLEVGELFITQVTIIVSIHDPEDS